MGVAFAELHIERDLREEGVARIFARLEHDAVDARLQIAPELGDASVRAGGAARDDACVALRFEAYAHARGRCALRRIEHVRRKRGLGHRRRIVRPRCRCSASRPVRTHSRRGSKSSLRRRRARRYANVCRSAASSCTCAGAVSRPGCPWATTASPWIQRTTRAIPRRVRCWCIPAASARWRSSSRMGRRTSRARSASSRATTSPQSSRATSTSPMWVDRPSGKARWTSRSSLSDLAVRGGRVVTANGVVDADLIVLGGVIARLVAPGEGDARDVIDARGLVVLPGVVDAHVHVNEPGRADWEGWLAATRGAAAGGTTTIADMPLNSIPPTIDAGAFDLKYDVASENAIVDFALWGGLVDADLDRLRELAACGVVGVKAFMCPSGVAEFPHLRDGELELALRAATTARLLVAVHCEDEATIAVTTSHVRRDGRRDPRAWLESRPPGAERIAIVQLANAARAAKARIHVVHASSYDALTAIGAALADGADLTAETCPHYLTFTAADVDRVGPALKCAPPIRGDDRERLWRDILKPAWPERPLIEYIASDH